MRGYEPINPPPKGNEYEWMYQQFLQVSEVLNNLVAAPLFKVPTSLSVVAGGTPVGDVTNVQELLDGNVYQLPEVAATPGYNLEFIFTNVTSIVGFVSHVRYTGSATHLVTLGLYNVVTATYDRFLNIPHTATLYGYRTVYIPNGKNYIDANQETKMIIYHDSGGVPSHNLYVDYAALLTK